MKKTLIVGAVLLSLFAVFSGISIVLSLTAKRQTGQTEFYGMPLKYRIIENPYETWKKDKHAKESIVCGDCHYKPGERAIRLAKFRESEPLFSYLVASEREGAKRIVVDDLSCTTSDCHPKEPKDPKKENFWIKKIRYKSKIHYISENVEYKGDFPFTHKEHEEKTIEGQKLHCTSCHMKYSAEKHFEVPKEACFLCHFRKAKFNEERGKCYLCHKVPTEPLKAKGVAVSEEKEKEPPLTHETLEKKGVKGAACNWCHYELIAGKEEVKKYACIGCHRDATPKLLKKWDDKKVMHEEHVAKQSARCFDCHETIYHKKLDFLVQPLQDCSVCHPEVHIHQKLLLVGEKRRDVEKTPSLHLDVKTNCMGCHIEAEKGKDRKGQKLAAATEKTCVICHKEGHKEMLERWKKEVDEALKEARKTEKEVREAIEKAKGKVSEEKLKKAMAVLKEGKEDLDIVEFGGGVHNKKYSLLMINTAMTDLEEVIDYLGGK